MKKFTRKGYKKSVEGVKEKLSRFTKIDTSRDHDSSISDDEKPSVIYLGSDTEEQLTFPQNKINRIKIKARLKDRLKHIK